MSIDKCEPFNKKEFAERLKSLREEVYPNAQDFAELLDLSVRQYGKYENPDVDQTPDLRRFHLIVQICQTSPGYLLQGVGPRYIDFKSAQKLTVVMNKAFDHDNPNYGMIIRRLLHLTENQIQLMIDLIPTISTYDPVLKKSFFDETGDF